MSHRRSSGRPHPNRASRWSRRPRYSSGRYTDWINSMFQKLAFFAWAAAAFAQTVPTPESVLGHKPGDDFYLASYDDSLDYFKKLAASSNRIKLISVGKTTRGVDWEVALISSPENLAQLDKYKSV